MKEIDTPYGPGIVGVVDGGRPRYPFLLPSLMALQVPKGSDFVEASSCNVAENCNHLCDYVVEHTQYQWLWIMGDDHWFEADTLLKLLVHKKDCIVPITPRRFFPFDPVVYRTFEPHNNVYDHFTWKDIEQFKEPFPVAAAGSAGLLVQRHVLERMPTPRFMIGRYHPSQQQEDLYFTAHANRIGHQVYCDPYAWLGHAPETYLFPYRRKDEIGIGINISGHRMSVIPVGYTAIRSSDGKLTIESNRPIEVLNDGN